MTHLIDTGSPEVTLKTYGSTIKSLLKEDWIELDMDKCQLASLIRACKLMEDHSLNVRLSIQRGLMRLIIDKIK